LAAALPPLSPSLLLPPQASSSGQVSASPRESVVFSCLLQVVSADGAVPRTRVHPTPETLAAQGRASAVL
jgi:hypothetical protein